MEEDKNKANKQRQTKEAEVEMEGADFYIPGPVGYW